MITKTDLIIELGSATALAREAGCTKQAVSQWDETIPVGSAIKIAQKGRWSLHDLRPDIFGDPPPAQLAETAVASEEPPAQRRVA